MKGFKMVRLDRDLNELYCKPGKDRFIFEIGKTYKKRKLPLLCNHGFHFCTSVKDVKHYYSISNSTFFMEVDTCDSKTDIGNNKVASQHIKIVRNIPLLEVATKVGLKLGESKKIRMFTSKKQYKNYSILFNTVELAMIFHKRLVERKTVTVTKTLYNYIVS